jgi:hypothetical protein
MTKHRPKPLADVAARAALATAVQAAHAELERRQAYKHLKYLEGRITQFAPVPGDPPYVETFPDLDPDLDKS